MKKLFTLIFCALAVTSQVRADKVTASSTAPSDGRPEHIYNMCNGNGAYVSPTTSPVQGDEEYGEFAFYPVDNVSGAYYIYSYNAKKWLSYSKSSSYNGMKGFIQMTDSKTEGAYFYVDNYSGDNYQISPYSTYGSVSAIYLNYFQGVAANAGQTLGLWTDGGAADAGSRYTFTEVQYVVRTYTINAPEGCNVTINGTTYQNGGQITIEGSLDKSDVLVKTSENEFAVVSINDIEATVTVSIAVLPEQPAVQPYANAWVYPKQQDNVGAAQAVEQEGVYTLSNNVLAASFLRIGNSMFFAGSNAMNLLAGTELFTVAFGNGDNVPASAMTLNSVALEDLSANSNAIGGAEHFPGKQLVANYSYAYNEAKIEIVWRAILRDGSHYLRTEMELKGVDDVDMYNVIPMIYNVDTEAAGSTPQVVGNTRGAVLMSNKIFAGLETPTAYNTVGEAAGEADPWELAETKSANLTATSWTQVASNDVPNRVTEATGASYPNVLAYKMENVELKKDQKIEIEVKYTNGNHRLNFGGADLLETSGNIAAVDYHSGYSGGQQSNNTFSFIAPYDGTFSVRVFVENKTEDIDASSTMTVKIYNAKEGVTVNTAIVGIQGRWSRNTTLAAGETWKVGAVVGLVAQDGSEAESNVHDSQKRRSFLAYSERERAVPWRPFPHYNSWYELNINRNNAAPGSEHTNFTSSQVLDVMEQWKTNYYDKFGEGIVAFVIDDGWDNYGPWTFHSGFPNEMRDMAAAAKEMGAGVGAWLGPVGGYGQSGNYRRAYWNTNSRGGMQLSNPLYYQAFLDAARNLVCNQDGVEGFDANSDNYLFFKFDGISAQFSSVGPDAGDTGNENAEGIIRLERYVREELREDIFFNTTVGTWASPFWYQISDGTWRQENDYGEAGNNSIDREKWITYRDRLVYQNYVQNSPICPINTLMTHGFILTSYGAVSKNMTYESVLRELRCAFVCGSGMVELYADYERLNNINNGKLWEDIAECVAWQKKNADVLPDAHWVGGNPWTGSVQEIYGWASWNGTKATLALRNGANNAQTYTFTLREALNIPANINGSMIFNKSFKVQDALTGFAEGEAIDYDRTITVTLPASSLFAFDGEDTNAPLSVNSVTPIEAVEELAEIKITFNGDIESDFDWSQKLTAGDVEVALTASIEGKVLTLTPAEAITTPAEYTLVIPADKIYRKNDHSQFAGAEYTFTVKAMEPLAVVSVNPDADVESLSVIELTFNYDVLSNLIEEDVINVVGDGVSVEAVANVEGKVLTLTLAEAITTIGTYTVVIPADKIVRVKDNAAFAGYTVTINVVAPDYYTPRNTGTKTYRPVQSVSLSSPIYGDNTYSLLSSEQTSDYVDATEKVTFKVQTGETVTASVTTSGEWIHHFVYIDTDADGFDFGIAEGSSYEPAGDLYSYSFYNNDSSSDESGWNSVGNVITGNNRSTPSLPSFVAPSVAGTYRMRFKQDWCNIDPMGDADGKFNDFKDNGGQIIDVMLEVVWPVGIESIEADSKVKGIYDLTGRKLENISAPGIYIVDGKKRLVK